MASTGIRRTLGWVVVASLCVAAAVAAVAIVGGSFDRTDGYVVVTSLGFAVFSATAAAGGALGRRDATLRAVGAFTSGVSGLAFALQRCS